jgi:hypothetical protein
MNLHSLSKIFLKSSSLKEIDFTNELGNNISISIETEDAAKNVAGVNIKIIGPTSMSENIITVQEAKVLQKLLNDYFDQI